MARVHKLNHGKGWTDTPIAFQHGGGIRTSIDVISQDGKYISKHKCSLNTIF
jgi:hypothetical protein